MSASQFPPLQSKPSTRHCTNCRPNEDHTLRGIRQHGRDRWAWIAMRLFDQFESMHVTRRHVALFQLIISTAVPRRRPQVTRDCAAYLWRGMKLPRSSQGHAVFLSACRKGHGRFTTFYNFLSESVCARVNESRTRQTFCNRGANTLFGCGVR